MDFTGEVTVDPSQDDGSLFIEDEAPQVMSGPICKTCGKAIPVEPGKRGRKPSYHPECKPSAPKSAPRKKTAKKSVGAPDYETGLNGIFQMMAFGLTVFGERNEMLLADGLAVAEHGQRISSALNELAMEKPEVAAVLDKVLAVGPYGVVMAAVTPLVMQVAANHGAPIPGVLSAKDYLKSHTPVAQSA